MESNLRFWITWEAIEFYNQEVNPLVTQDFGISYKPTPGQYFFREELNSDLTFQRRDWNLLNDAPLETEFIITVEEKNGSVWSQMFKGIFSKTDCKFNPTLREIKVKPDPYDNYRDILAKKDNELNVVELGLTKRELYYTKSSVLQIYFPGSGFATNIYAGDVVENIYVTNPTVNPLTLNEYHFNNLLNFDYVRHFIPGSHEIKGYYDPDTFKSLSPLNRFKLVRIGWVHGDGTLVYEDPTNYGIALDNHYAAFTVTGSTLNEDTHFGTTFTVGGIPFTYLGRAKDSNGITWEMFKRQGTTGGNSGFPTTATGTIVGAVTVSYTSWLDVNYNDFPAFRYGIYDTTPSSGSARITWIGQCYPNRIEYEGDYTPHYSYGTTFKRVSLLTDNARWFSGLPVARILTNNAQIYFPAAPTLVDCFELGAEDLTDHGYKYAYPVNLVNYDVNYLKAKDDHETIDNHFGKFPDSSFNTPGEYYKAFPTLFPINENEWTSVAWWFQKPAGVNIYHNETIITRDAYLISDVISGILAKNSPTITFDKTEAHSKFLYAATNPLTGSATHNFLFTAKSNILKPGYDKPASQAKIKWVDVESFLMAMKLHWYVDSSKRLRIEHDKFFEYGGDYTIKQVGNDLTELYDNTNGRKLSEGLEYEYEKTQIPEKTTIKWMDEVSRYFDKSEIVCLSKFKDIGNVEETRVSNITTDMLFAQGSPNSLSKDGFFVIHAAKHPNFTYYVSQAVLVNCYDLRTRSLHNGFLSSSYLMYWFHNINLPSLNCTVNNYESGNFALQTARKTKKQEVTYPVKVVDLLKLVNTDLGQGRIKEATYYFFKRSLKATIIHEP